MDLCGGRGDRQHLRFEVSQLQYARREPVRSGRVLRRPRVGPVELAGRLPRGVRGARRSSLREPDGSRVLVLRPRLLHPGRLDGSPEPASPLARGALPAPGRAPSPGSPALSSVSPPLMPAELDLTPGKPAL